MSAHDFDNISFDVTISLLLLVPLFVWAVKQLRTGGKA